MSIISIKKNLPQRGLQKMTENKRECKVIKCLYARRLTTGKGAAAEHEMPTDRP